MTPLSVLQHEEEATLLFQIVATRVVVYTRVLCAIERSQVIASNNTKSHVENLRSSVVYLIRPNRESKEQRQPLSIGKQKEAEAEMNLLDLR